MDLLDFLEVSEIASAVEDLGYDGHARRVAWWWEPMEDALAWADSNSGTAVGRGNNSAWWETIAPMLFIAGQDCGSRSGLGTSILVWDRHDRRVWIAPRAEGLAFVADCYHYDGVS